MPATVVVVHDDQEFVEHLVAALMEAGHGVAAFRDPLAALDALDAPERIEVLVTRVAFPPGKSNGIALACMARRKRPKIRVIYTALPQFAEDVDERDIFLPVPVNVANVVTAVERALTSDDAARSQFWQGAIIQPEL